VRVLILEVPRTPGVLRAGGTRQTFETALRLVADIVQRGQQSGELRRDVEPMVCAASVLGVLDMNLTGMVTGMLTAPQPGEEELERMKRQVVEVALGALRPGMGPPRAEGDPPRD
jgi:hypothetical protein